MTTARRLFKSAVRAHREAAHRIGAVGDELRRAPLEPVYGAESVLEQAALVTAIDQIAGQLTPGWWSASWDSPLGERTLGVDGTPGRFSLLRIGSAHPVSDGFGVLVPFIGAGHLCIDLDARDPRVNGFLRGVLLRVLAAMPAGAVRVLAVDGGTLGATFTPLLPLVAAELMERPEIDLEGFRAYLSAAEDRVESQQFDPDRDDPTLVLAIAAMPSGASSAEYSRLAALAHTGPRYGVHLLVAGYPPQASLGRQQPPPLANCTVITADGEHFTVGNPPGEDAFGSPERGLSSPVQLDSGPPDHLLAAVCGRIAAAATESSLVRFADLVPQQTWQESSVDGLRAMIGRTATGGSWLALDDATPHWLVAGRTGSGKTVFLLDILYSLTSRYSPAELSLYLLDFKEGVSFTEFIPTEVDPTWMPHARAVGVESDREYGVAVLAALLEEMSRRASTMKRVGVSNYADLRERRPDHPLPRVLTVIDEFQALFAGNDGTAKRAGALLEELARKGRSYGIHLILASQTTSGIEALFAKGEAIFGQFSQRVALAGGGGVLSQLNSAADDLERGFVILNDAGGIASGNTKVRFPDVDPALMTQLRTRFWQARTPDSPPPAQFLGYAEQRIEQDPGLALLGPDVRRRRLLLGRCVDVEMTTAQFALDASPGRHLAVLGASAVGAGVLHAAAWGLARQHEPGAARFVIASLVGAADSVVDEVVLAVREGGHPVGLVDAAGLRAELGRLVGTVGHGSAARAGGAVATYVLVFGADAAGGVLKASRDPATGKTGLDDLRTLLHQGPSAGVHLIGWWRGVRRFTDDIGPSGRDEVAGLVVLNLSAQEVGSLLGEYNLDWSPRPNRALLVDRHENSRTLIVPFTRPATGSDW